MHSPSRASGQQRRRRDNEPPDSSPQRLQGEGRQGHSLRSPPRRFDKAEAQGVKAHSRGAPRTNLGALAVALKFRASDQREADPRSTATIIPASRISELRAVSAQQRKEERRRETKRAILERS